jgi:hypothetical protein
VKSEKSEEGKNSTSLFFTFHFSLLKGGRCIMKHLLRSLFVVLSMFALITVVCVPNIHAQARTERPRDTGTSATSTSATSGIPEVITVPIVGITNAETPPDVKIWTDKGDNNPLPINPTPNPEGIMPSNPNMPVYYIGEQIYISFQSKDKDCYITIYDIDSIGNVNILFPNPYYPDNLVRGGRIYTLPADISKYNFILRGPSGIEALFVVASSYVYYHWRYGETPPPIWSDQWGSPSTWGHPGGSDESIISRRLERRLQEQPYSMVNSTIEFIRSEARLKVPMSVAIDYGESSLKSFIRIPGTNMVFVWDRQNAKNHLQIRNARAKLNVGFAQCQFYVSDPPY